MNVTEKIAETVRAVFLREHGADSLAEAVVAAIRAMTPTEQAELIGGDVDYYEHVTRGHLEYAIGPMREVTR